MALLAWAANLFKQSDPGSGEGVIATESGALYLQKSNLSAVAAPTSGDNFAAGWKVGSVWHYAGNRYVCTGDGVWKQFSMAGHEHSADNITSGTLAEARGGVPVGSVVPFAGASAPSGWLLLHGQAVSRSTYSDLFSLLGTTYGSGDGSTTFNLPDLRGRVVAGKDNMGGSSANRLTSPINGDVLGNSGGDESHTLTTSQIPSHSHSMNHSHTYSRWGSVIYADYPAGGRPTLESNVNTNTSTYYGSTGSAGSGSSHPNVQPTIILNYIVFAGA